jgi:ABC-type Na+ efflux pump permease subunit
MSISKRRVRAIFRKELREYRRNGSLVIGTMAVIPLIFIIPPMINVFALPASAAAGLRQGSGLLYMLGIPAIVRGPEILAQLVFTPLVAAWSIWVGMTISIRRATSGSPSSSACSPASRRSR